MRLNRDAPWRYVPVLGRVLSRYWDGLRGSPELTDALIVWGEGRVEGSERQNDLGLAAMGDVFAVAQIDGAAMGLDDLAGKRQANSASACFGRKEGSEQIVQIGQTRPEIFDEKTELFILGEPSEPHAGDVETRMGALLPSRILAILLQHSFGRVFR